MEGGESSKHYKRRNNTRVGKGVTWTRNRRECAYNLFQKWYMQKAKDAGKSRPNICNKEFANEVAKAWSELDAEGKKTFQNEAAKIKGVDGGKKGSFSSRCCPQQIIRFVRELGKRRKMEELINEMGFESFIQVNCGNMPKAFILALVSNFDPFKGELRARGERKVVSVEDVVELLGIPNGDDPLPNDPIGGMEVAKRMLEIAKNEARRKWKEGGKVGSAWKLLVTSKNDRPNLTDIKLVLESSEVEDSIRKQAFLILALGSVLCPTSSQFPSPRLYNAVVDVRNVRRFKWGEFVLDWLCDEVSAFNFGERQRNAEMGKQSLGGCLLLLMLFFFERFPLKKSDKRPEHEHPLKFWNKQRISHRLKMEAKYASFNPNEGIGQHASYYSKWVSGSNLVGDISETKKGCSKFVEIAKSLMGKHMEAFTEELGQQIGNVKVDKKKRKQRVETAEVDPHVAKMARRSKHCADQGYIKAESVGSENVTHREECKDAKVLEDESEDSMASYNLGTVEVDGHRDGGRNEGDANTMSSYGGLIGDLANEVKSKLVFKGRMESKRAISMEAKEDKVKVVNVLECKKGKMKIGNEVISRCTTPAPCLEKTSNDSQKAPSWPSRPITRALRAKLNLEVREPLLMDRAKKIERPADWVSEGSSADGIFSDGHKAVGIVTTVSIRAFNADEKKLYYWATRPKVRGETENPFVVSFGKGLALFRDDCRCLAPRQCISNIVMDFFAALLNRREDNSSGSRKHYFSQIFSSTIVANAGGDKKAGIKAVQFNASSHRRKISEKQLGYALPTCHMMFIPILYKEHWYLFVLNMNAKRLDVMDSDAYSHIDDRLLLEENVVYVMTEVLTDLAGQEFSVKDYKHELVPVPQQDNNYDCGLFVMKIMEFWDGECIVDFDPKTLPAKFRMEYVVDWLCNPANHYLGATRKLAGLKQ